MEDITRTYNLMLKTLSVLNMMKIVSLPKVKGLVYTIFSRIANLQYAKKQEYVISDVIDETESIVSLTSFGKRMAKVHIALDTIFSQSVRPYKVVLWLSDDEFTIDSISQELKERLEKYDFFDICFCEDIKPHKKYYEAMRRYQGHNIITADDDVFYPEDWLYTLTQLHRKYPDSVICNNAHKMAVEDSSIGSYDKWSFLTSEQGPSITLCPVGVGGVLYPPDSLSKDVFKKETIRKTCLYADDLWLRIMGIINGTTVVNSNKYHYTFLRVDGAKDSALSISNVTGGQNNVQLKNILEIYDTQIRRYIK